MVIPLHPRRIVQFGMFDPPWDGPGSSRSVNLSTATSSSSSALLSSVRAERLARERTRQLGRAALVLQAAWRGRSDRRRVKRDLLERLDSGQIQGLERGARGLIVLLRDGIGDDEDGRRREKLLERWCIKGKEVEPGESLACTTQFKIGETWVELEKLTPLQSRERRGPSTL